MSKSIDDLALDTLNEVYAEIWSDTVAMPRVKRLEMLLALSAVATVTQMERRLKAMDEDLKCIWGLMREKGECKDAEPPHNGVLAEEDVDKETRGNE